MNKPTAWQTRSVDSAALAQLQQSGLSPTLARVLAARGVESEHDLELRLAQLLPAQALKGLDRALDRLEYALDHRERILIVGDFDCDGATSTALMMRGLGALGADVNYLVPDRFRFGYGLTPEIIDHAAETMAFDLIVTVDNGISSREGVERATQLGKDVIITDHHLTARDLPEAAAIVNPNQSDCAFASKSLVGAGVAFYVLAALSTRRRAAQKPTVKMTDYLDLVALGTVADVGQLDRNNRILVQAGLDRIRRRQCSAGILALLELASCRASEVQSRDLGFVVGPRINAAGRMEHMRLGIECLLADSYDEAFEKAKVLDQLNRERRDVEQQMKREALALLDPQTVWGDREPSAAVVLYRPDWHQGVIGIVAGRLKDQFYRPTIVFAPSDPNDPTSLLKGSARSVDGIHVRDCIEKVADRHEGLITHFGGHAMAAGLSLPREHFDAFAQAFETVIAEHDPALLQPVLLTDGELGGDEFALSTVEQLEQLGPWGQGFVPPLFEGEFEVLEQRLLKDQHLKLMVRHPSGGWLDAIQFGTDTSRWPDESVERVRLAYTLVQNEFRGERSLQLRIASIEAVSGA